MSAVVESWDSVWTPYADRVILNERAFLGEETQDRISLLHQLASMPVHPESVPINRLVVIKGTPLENEAPVAAPEMVRYNTSHILVTLFGLFP